MRCEGKVLVTGQPDPQIHGLFITVGSTPVRHKVSDIEEGEGVIYTPLPLLGYNGAKFVCGVLLRKRCHWKA